MPAYMHKSAYMPACLHTCILDVCMQKVDSLDEAAVVSKIGIYNLHQATLDYTFENFEATLTKYKAMLEDA